MQSFLRAIAKIRMSLWWHHIIAPLLGVLYTLLLLGKTSILSILPSLGWFVVSILGTASMGYWINDWTDQRQDLAVGKKNATIGYSTTQKVMVLTLFFLIALVPWLFLPRYFLSFGLWIILVLSLVIYSVPPFRWKEKTLLGIFCDNRPGPEAGQ